MEDNYIKLTDCPFCGDDISVFIGMECGSEPNGYVSVNHVCSNGLVIEWFEEGQDTEDVRRALTMRTVEG